MNPSGTRRCFVLLLGGVLLAGCATPKETFYHVSHRENFALQDAEIASLQFYISREVLAKNVADEGSASSVIIVPIETAGRVLEVGGDWIRVSFQQGGEGVYFLADPGGGLSAYWLATEVEGKPGLHPVKDLDEKILRAPSGDYQVVYGANAQLLVSRKELDELIATRTHAQGRTGN